MAGDTVGASGLARHPAPSLLFSNALFCRLQVPFNSNPTTPNPVGMLNFTMATIARTAQTPVVKALVVDMLAKSPTLGQPLAACMPGAAVAYIQNREDTNTKVRTNRSEQPRRSDSQPPTAAAGCPRHVQPRRPHQPHAHRRRLCGQAGLYRL